MELTVERIEPEHLFAYRWHPYAVEPGFDRIPLARRATAFRMNDEGWAAQLRNIAQYVAT